MKQPYFLNLEFTRKSLSPYVNNVYIFPALEYRFINKREFLNLDIYDI